MHNTHCFIFGPTARRAALRRPRRQPGWARPPLGREKRRRGPKKPLGGVSARCHTKAPPKDRIFGRTRSSRHGGSVLTCGSPEPTARSIRPIDEIPILWRDFCSGAGRPRRFTRRFQAGGQPIVHKLDECAHKLAECPEMATFGKFVRAFVKIMHPPVSTPAFFECLRATCTRDAPCTRPTRDALLRHTPTPHTAPHRAPRAASRNGPAECNAPPARHNRREPPSNKRASLPVNTGAR